MKAIQTWIIAATLPAALLAAQPRYTIIDLGASLPPGWASQATFVSNLGVVTGVATAPDGTQRAALWVGRRLVDISKPGLGGPNSGALGVNFWGQVVGQAESADPDPHNENFCGYGTGKRCLPFAWRGGPMVPLPLLGGNNGAAGPINARGEAVGIAETGHHDTDAKTGCPSTPALNGTGPQYFDFRGAIWGPGAGQPRALQPLPGGDTVSMALWINDNGQAVGISGTCANTMLPPIAVGPYAVLWDSNGSVTNLGSLGGTGTTSLLGVGNAALAINNRGQVVGASALRDNRNNHAFLWTRETGMRDLGTLAGFGSSAAVGINARGDAVGTSYDPGVAIPELNLTATVWRNGEIADLKQLSVGISPFDLLFFATGINDAGLIAGFGLTNSGDLHAFLAIPSGVVTATDNVAPATGASFHSLAIPSAERSGGDGKEGWPHRVVGPPQQEFHGRAANATLAGAHTAARVELGGAPAGVLAQARQGDVFATADQGRGVGQQFQLAP